MNIQFNYANYIIKMDVSFVQDGEQHHLPVLKTKLKSTKTQYWNIYVIDSKIYRKVWVEHGKCREYPVIECTSKNVNKSNETTPHLQALSEAKSKWLKQISKGYVINYNVNTPEIILPMLAQTFTERKKYIKYPCAVSRKLDGIRMISRLKDDNTIELTSRTGKPFKYIELIRNHLKDIISTFDNIVLDGEIYSHVLPFNVISGSIRTTKSKSTHDDKLEYWIFDIVDCTKTYKERAEILKSMYNYYTNKYKFHRVLKFVLYDIAYNEQDIINYHNTYVNEGYEGIIIRNLNGVYELKHRSNNLQKYKNFEDDEFEIHNFKLGTGTEKDAIIFECKYDNGKTFDVRPRGTIDERIKKGKIGNTFIGKKLTVRYQPSIKQSDNEKNELPRFPIGIEIRDYE